MQAALEAIEADGPHALTGQIAERAGLARTHVYRHFGSKAELDQAVARAARTDLTGRIRSTLGASGRPIDLLRAPIGAMVMWAQARPNTYRFLVARSAGSSGRPWPHGALAAEVIALARRYLSAFGVTEADDLEAAMTGVIGLVDTRVLWWLEHGAADAEALSDELADSAWVLLQHYLRRVGVSLDSNEMVPLPD